MHLWILHPYEAGSTRCLWSQSLKFRSIWMHVTGELWRPSWEQLLLDGTVCRIDVTCLQWGANSLPLLHFVSWGLSAVGWGVLIFCVTNLVRKIIPSISWSFNSSKDTYCSLLGDDSTHSGRQAPVAYPGILFAGGSTNSVEDRGQRERGSGGSRPLVRGSGGSCNLVQKISFHIVKFS